MKACVSSKGYDLYLTHDTAKSLAEKVLEKHLGRKPEVSDLPLNPFKIAKESGAMYHFMDFQDMEGFYLPPINPINEKSLAVISIKWNTDIFRQRYTIAHELGHHLVDNECPKISIQQSGQNTQEESFANEFATNLLLPENVLNALIDKCQLDKCQSDMDYMEKILKIAFEAGMSLQATYIRVDRILHKK